MCFKFGSDQRSLKPFVTSCLPKEEQPEKEDEVIESEDEGVRAGVGKKRVNRAAANPDAEYETVGTAIAEPVAKKPMQQSTPQKQTAEGSGIASASSASKAASASKASPAAAKPAPPIHAEKRGTAGIWIHRLPLESILEGSSHANPVRHAEQLMSRLDEVQQRRLRTHLNLRDVAMKLWRAP